jgi:hypothetical protein
MAPGLAQGGSPARCDSVALRLVHALAPIGDGPFARPSRLADRSAYSPGDVQRANPPAERSGFALGSPLEDDHGTRNLLFLRRTVDRDDSTPPSRLWTRGPDVTWRAWSIPRRCHTLVDGRWPGAPTAGHSSAIPVWFLHCEADPDRSAVRLRRRTRLTRASPQHYIAWELDSRPSNAQHHAAHR